MPGIPKEVIEHSLKIYPEAKPVQQRVRKQAIVRQDFVREEVKKLLRVRFVREVHHPQWWGLSKKCTTLSDKTAHIFT